MNTKIKWTKERVTDDLWCTVCSSPEDGVKMWYDLHTAEVGNRAVQIRCVEGISEGCDLKRFILTAPATWEHSDEWEEVTEDDDYYNASLRAAKAKAEKWLKEEE